MHGFRTGGLRGASALSDLAPPSYRYGVLRRASRTVLGTVDLPVVADTAGLATRSDTQSVVLSPITPELTCALLTGSLDVGGVEAVVETLATQLPAVGVQTSVICTAEGRTADRIRAAGVPVLEASGPDEVRAALRAVAPDVIEVHNAPAALEGALNGSTVPYVWVVHNLEIHRTSADWAAVRDAAEQAVATIAVSDAVRRHHLSHVRAAAAERTIVVPNGVNASFAQVPRSQARKALERVVALEPDDVVVVSLARYDAQKNLPALVRAFARAAVREPRLRLVVAGGVPDVLEYRWTDAERTSGPASDRVHLLGPSDSATLLASADAFVLNSFFEGWSVAATEAVIAGVPAVLSDVGGAVDLARVVPGWVTVVPAPTGTATVDDRSVRAARRRTRQANDQELVEALVALADRPETPAPARALTDQLSSSEMVRRHAEVLRAALQGSLDPPGPSETAR